MPIRNTENLVQLLEDMSKAESSLAELYKSCAERWEEDQDLWLSLEREERGHAETLKKIADVVLQKPEKMEAGRAFSPVAIQTFIKGARDSIELVKKGEIRRDQMLFKARDIENAILESKYAEIVKSNDLEYQNLIKEIVNETYNHKKLITQKIESLKK